MAAGSPQKMNGVTQDMKKGKQQKYWDPIAEGLKWIEQHAELAEKYFEKLPNFLSTFIATFAIFTFGSCLRGEWVVILVAALKQISGHTQSERNVSTAEVFDMLTLKNLKMENFSYFFIVSHVISYGTYFLLGGFLHWYYYTKRRHIAHEWKLQPNKWLSPELELHEIKVGLISLFVTGSFASFLATYIANGNPSTVYFQFDEYGWTWFFLQFPVIFLYQDFTTYFLHRIYHTRFLYKHFHKLHHTYKQPTAFSATAIHPFEILHIQMNDCVPLFTIPVHWLPFYTIAIYTYYYGIIDHTGINFKAPWWQPWLPDVAFHDKHHEIFHCNFGFNMTLWDKWFGTLRKPNHVYSEDTFHGEAPLLDTDEAKKILDADPELKEELMSTLTNKKSQ